MVLLKKNKAAVCQGEDSEMEVPNLKFDVAKVCGGYQKRAELFVFGRFWGYLFVGTKR